MEWIFHLSEVCQLFLRQEKKGNSGDRGGIVVDFRSYVTWDVVTMGVVVAGTSNSKERGKKLVFFFFYSVENIRLV